MQFALTEDQQFLVDQIQQFASQTLTPAPEQLPDDVATGRLISMAEQGMLGLRVPERLDGPGIDATTLTRSISALASYDGSVALAAAANNGFLFEYLLLGATEAQQKQWLPPLMQAEQWAAWCDQPEGPAASCQREGESWRLQGSFGFVPLAGVAAHFLIVAKDEHDTTHAFWVPKATQGLQVTPIQRPLGCRNAAIARVELKDLSVQAEARVGTEGDQSALREQAWRRTHVALAAASLGLAQAALRESIAYAKERKQFGKPIAAFQAIQWKIADLAMECESVRLLIDRAAYAWEQGDEEGLAAWSSVARLKSTELAALAGQEAIQIHGGYGFTTEFPVERLYRDAHALRACWINRPHANEQVANYPFQQQL